MSRLVIVVAAVLFAILSGCDKVPLQENRGTFDTLNAHWFAGEKTEYVFFSISGLRAGQAGRLQISTGSTHVQGLALQADGFAELDLSKGLHRHRLVECGKGRICGSFSFASEQPVDLVRLRYFYSVGSSLQETATINTTVHADSNSIDGQSALIFGVFNGDNSRVQVRVHDNFGSPNSDDVASYGLERSFAVENLQLATLSDADEAQVYAVTGSNYLFPAAVCTAQLSAGGGQNFRFNGRAGWAGGRLDVADPRSDACFNLRMLDQNGNTVRVQPAVARRNPEFASQTITLHPPTRDAQMVPIVVSYCLNRDESPRFTSADFLRYQYFILGIPGDHPVDACFAPGEEDRFSRDLDRALSQRLVAARGSSAGRDFFYTVVVNHVLPASVHQKLRELIGKSLAQKINSELLMVSPRLVGAFVYDSRALDGAASSSNAISWCPRQERAAGSDPNAVEANCTPGGLDRLDLGVVNFNLPMGPFPTVDRFVQHLRESGDRGESRNPRFSVRSIQTNSSSHSATDSSVSYTFFDNERLSLAPGQSALFCPERDSTGVLADLVMRPEGGTAVMNVVDAQAYLNADNPAPLHFGLQWHQPYIGTFSFDAPVSGHILTIIPISKSFGVEQTLGDPLWSQSNWNLGPLIQQCTRHCQHPYFDEAGTYQIVIPWKLAGRCVQPNIQEPQ